MPQKKSILILLFLCLIGAFAFFPTLGHLNLFDWDEINFAESAREMVVSGNYTQVTVNYIPFQEKPPLFFWLESISMHLFGVNEFAARFPNAICGILTLIILFFMGRKVKNEKFGLLWAATYLSTLLTQLYFRSAIIDPFFNLFIFLSLFCIYLVLLKKEPWLKYSLLAGGFCGLAILTKGPVALLLIVLTLFFFMLFDKFKNVPSLKQILLFAFGVFALSFPWFGFELIKNGPWFLVEFIQYQIELLLTPVAGHKQPFFYHFVVVFIGVFPLSILALPYLFKRIRTNSFVTLMACLTWTVLLVFTIVSTKIIHYSSLTYLPLSFLAATMLYHNRIEKYILNGILIFSLLLVTLITGAILVLQNFQLFSFWDEMTLYALNNSDIKWTGFEFLVGILILFSFGYLYKAFKKNKVFQGLVVHGILLSLGLNLLVITVAPQVEKLSQGPFIEFLKEKSKEENVNIAPVGFKSYAQYFYFEQKQYPNFVKEYWDENKTGDSNPAELRNEAINSLIINNVDRVSYFVTKRNYKRDLTQFNLELLYAKGIFNFYVKYPHDININKH